MTFFVTIAGPPSGRAYFPTTLLEYAPTPDTALREYVGAGSFPCHNVEMWKKAIFLALFCLSISTANAADPEKKESDSSPLKYSQLSPLARVVDNMLFGDGSALVPEDRNPMILKDWSSQLENSLKEVARYRGAEYQKLVDLGKKVHAQYLQQVNQAVTLKLDNDGLDKIFPVRTVLYDWHLLRSGRDANERPLSRSALQLRVEAETRTRFPQPYEQPRGDAIETTILGRLRARNEGVIETLEREPTPTTISRNEFEKWKQKQLEKLALARRGNLLSALKTGLKIDAAEFVQNKEGSKRRPVDFDFLMVNSIPAEFTDDVFAKSRLHFNSDMRAYISTDGITSLPLDYGGTRAETVELDKSVMGDLALERAVDLGFAAKRSGAAWHLFNFILDLRHFEYENYLKDGGKTFWKEWVDSSKYYSEYLQRDLSEELADSEAAFWGRFAESPDFWARRTKKRFGDSIRRHFTTRLKDYLSPPSDNGKAPSRLRQAISENGGSLRQALLSAALAGLVTLSSPAIQIKPFHSTDGMPPDLSAQGLAFNKLLSEQSKEPLFTIQSELDPALLPNRFVVGDPKIVYESRIGSERVAADFSIRSSKWHSSVAAIPTPDRVLPSAMKFVRVEDRYTGKPWVKDKDYSAKMTPDFEIIVVPLRRGDFSVEAGFDNKYLPPAKLEHPALRSLDRNEIREFSNELSQNGFVLLPEVLNRALETTDSKGAPISIFDMEALLKSSAYYSQVAEKTQFGVLLRSELNRASRFLNFEGTQCFQCDGAREFGVGAFKRFLSKKPGINVTPRNVFIREGSAMELSPAQGHADFKITADKQTSAPGIFIRDTFTMDTTPLVHDPRDPNPIPEEHVAATSLKQERESQFPVRILPSTAEELPAPVKESFWLELMGALMTEWQAGDYRRNSLGAASEKGVVGASPGEPLRSSSKTTELAETHVPKRDQIESDSRLADLELAVVKARRLAMDLKMKVAASQKMPLVSLYRVRDLLGKWATAEIPFADFRRDIGPYLPPGFHWPTRDEELQIRDALRAVAQHQLELLKKIQSAIARGQFPELAGLLDARLSEAVRDAFRRMAETPWRAPYVIAKDDSAARSNPSVLHAPECRRGLIQLGK